MWVTKFKLRDDKDIYTILCQKHKIEFYAYPYTCFIKDKKINLLGGGVLSGTEKNTKEFVKNLKKDKRVKNIEQYRNYIFVHAQHNLSKESEAEIQIFYNPQYVIVKPVHNASDGWEYWEIACLDRKELSKIIDTATRAYNGKLFYIKKEKLKSITSLELTPNISEKQLEAIKFAFAKGYYKYPRKLTIPQLAGMVNKSYSTFQENLRKAENKIIEYFLKYR